MSTIVTSLDVFSKADPERPCATITRVGGGRFQFRSILETGEPVEAVTFDSLADAEAHADQFVADVEADPGTIEDRVTLKQQLAQRDKTIAEQAARIVELEAKQPVEVADPTVKG